METVRKGFGLYGVDPMDICKLLEDKQGLPERKYLEELTKKAEAQGWY